MLGGALYAAALYTLNVLPAPLFDASAYPGQGSAVADDGYSFFDISGLVVLRPPTSAHPDVGGSTAADPHGTVLAAWGTAALLPTDMILNLAMLLLVVICALLLTFCF